MKQLTLLLLRTLCALLAVAMATSASATSSLNASERHLVQLACHHDVVMIGENSHGDGATIALKAKLIPELVRRCGFSAIAFEASFYDFAELSRRTKPRERYDRGTFLSAVGLLWARDAQFASLADWVSAQTPRTLQLAGLDDQIGAAGAFYSLGQMPTDLSLAIPASERSSCRDTMIAYVNWTTDRRSIQAAANHCLSLAIRHLSRENTTDAVEQLAVARAFRRANRWADMSMDQLNVREIKRWPINCEHSVDG